MEQLNVSWEEFHSCARRLASKLDTVPAGLIAISCGGLIPATILAHELDIRYIDTVCLASYNHNQQGMIEYIKPPLERSYQNMLLVDDLVDTGDTLKYIQKLYPALQCVAVYAKPQGKELLKHYTTDVPQSTWVNFPWENR